MVEVLHAEAGCAPPSLSLSLFRLVELFNIKLGASDLLLWTFFNVSKYVFLTRLADHPWKMRLECIKCRLVAVIAHPGDLRYLPVAGVGKFTVTQVREAAIANLRNGLGT